MTVNELKFRYSSVNSCSTSPCSTSNQFSSSTNTMIALTLPQPPLHCAISAGICVTTPAQESTSATIVSYPMSSMGGSGVVLGLEAALQRNNSVKSATKVLGSSPSCGVCGTTTTPRSCSLQNVSQSSRHRGNSITTIGGAVSVSGGGAAVASAAAPNTSGSNVLLSGGGAVEEHAVMPEPTFSSTVMVYDTLCLLPVSKELATRYKLLGGNALELCQYNLQQAQCSSRTDLVKLWTLLEQCIVSSNSERNFYRSARHGTAQASKLSSLQRSLHRTPWSSHPLGRTFINSLLDHYYTAFDIQTAAVITCVLGNRRRYKQMNFRRNGCHTSGEEQVRMSRSGVTTNRCRASGPMEGAIPFGSGSSDKTTGGSLQHIRSLSASLAPPSPGVAQVIAYQHQMGSNTSPYNHQHYGHHHHHYGHDVAAPSQLQQQLSQLMMSGGSGGETAPPLRFAVDLTSSNENNSGGGGFSDVSRLGRSNSFENDRQPLTISMEDNATAATGNAGTMRKGGGSVVGAGAPPPSRKTSNSYGMTPNLQFAVRNTIYETAGKLTALSDSDREQQLPMALYSSFKDTSLMTQFEQQYQQQHQQQHFVNSNYPLEVSVFNQNPDKFYCDFDEDDDPNELLLDPELVRRFEDIRLLYADILYRWGMYLKCAEVMKYCTSSMSSATSSDNETVGQISEISLCGSCGQTLRHTYKCPTCKRPPLNCAVCDAPCYGTIATCALCSHGGHLSHIAQWFDAQSTCPLNCGCECKL